MSHDGNSQRSRLGEGKQNSVWRVLYTLASEIYRNAVETDILTISDGYIPSDFWHLRGNTISKKSKFCLYIVTRSGVNCKYKVNVESKFTIKNRIQLNGNLNGNFDTKAIKVILIDRMKYFFFKRHGDWSRYLKSASLSCLLNRR